MHALHPLYRRSDLSLQDIFYGFNAVRGVKLARDVGDDGQRGQRHVQPVQYLAQRGAGGGHNLRVEGVADGDEAGFVPFSREGGHRLVHSLAGSAKNALAVAVDVGGDDVAVNFFERRFYHVQRRQHEGHFALVFYADSGHFTAAGGGGFQIVLEGHNAGSHQCRVLPQRMPHHHVRLEAI